MRGWLALWNVVLIPFFGVGLVAAGVADQQAREADLSFEVVKATSMQRVTHHAPELGPHVDFIEAGEGRVFIAIDLRFSQSRAETTLEECVLRASSGESYRPAGIAPYSSERWIHLFEAGDYKFGGMLLELGTADGQVVKYNGTDLVVEGEGHVFGLCYLVSSDDTGFELTIGDSQPVSVQVEPKS